MGYCQLITLALSIVFGAQSLTWHGLAWYNYLLVLLQENPDCIKNESKDKILLVSQADIKKTETEDDNTNKSNKKLSW